VRVFAPPDVAELLDGVGIPLTPVGWPIRALATAAVTGSASWPAGSAIWRSRSIADMK
jgi:hypothetical protein